MNDLNYLAFGIFAGFVIFVLWLSFYLAKKTKSASGFFAAHGEIHWGGERHILRG